MLVVMQPLLVRPLILPCIFGFNLSEFHRSYTCCCNHKNVRFIRIHCVNELMNDNIYFTSSKVHNSNQLKTFDLKNNLYLLNMFFINQVQQYSKQPLMSYDINCNVQVIVPETSGQRYKNRASVTHEKIQHGKWDLCPVIP